MSALLRGARAGLASDTWKNYKPEFVVCGSPGTLTQPVLDPVNGRYQLGRYLRRDYEVLVQIQQSYVGTFNVGLGGPYAWSLPFPARREFPGAISRRVIGNGMCYFSIADPHVNMECEARLADPWTSLNGREDEYFHLVAGERIGWGSSSVPVGASSVTVTHQMGFAPHPAAIQITNTGYGGGNNCWPPAIQNVTTTTFDVVLRAGAGATFPWTFDWKINADPPSGQGEAYVGPFVPWDWTRGTFIGPFGNIFIEIVYEPA